MLPNRQKPAMGGGGSDAVHNTGTPLAFNGNLLAAGATIKYHQPPIVLEHNTNTKRSPTFDSLRGMGVVLVMLYHLRLGVPNAWACIGLFFAGSGFVMTVMAIEVVAKKGSLNAPFFWKRRVLRLFPALQVQ